MKKLLIKKTLVLGVIILLAGMAITPTITGGIMVNTTSIKKINKVLLSQNNSPIANFTYEPSEITTGDLVYFNSTSYDPDGIIINWTWNFGDGNSTYNENVTHQYNNNGVYTVNLTVMDNSSANDSIEKTIFVGNQPPVANFAFLPEFPTANETVYFSDTSFDVDGVIISWWWDFGDGYFSDLQNPMHKYFTEDVYFVDLSVTDDDGVVDTVVKNVSVIEVNNPPYAPSNPYPSDGMIDVDLDINLSWNCSDPNNDQLTYDVYFGNVSTPPKVVANQTNTSFYVGLLDMEMTYYWQVIAWDEHNFSTTGQIWSFTTLGPPNDPPYGPIVTGPSLVQIGKEYTFMFQSSDPDEDYIRFIVTWGDSTETESEFVPDNTPVILNHTWSTIFPVMILKMTAVAEDHHGAKSMVIEKWVIVIWFQSVPTVYSVPTQKITPNQNSQSSTQQLSSTTSSSSSFINNI